MQNPIYTEVTSCRDCYKCVRSCPVKAIQIKDGHAMIIKDRCLYCGRCVHVCPNNAKKIRNDVDRVKLAIQSGRRVICSLAPSYASEFGGREKEAAKYSRTGLKDKSADSNAIAAYVLRIAGNYKAAAGYATRAINIDNGHIGAMETLGICLAEKGEYDKARIVAGAINEKSPGDKAALNVLSYCEGH